MPCPFCKPGPDRVVMRDDHAIALRDGFPISEGHTLVVPRRHVAGLFDLTPDERAAVWHLVAEVRGLLQRNLAPDGFNIGLNDGEAAGQTVLHAHVHVIPRRLGDVADPRGGVRWILPDRAAYWEDR